MDRQLQSEGRLTVVTSLEQIQAIPLVHRTRPEMVPEGAPKTLLSIVDTIEEIVAATRRSS